MSEQQVRIACLQMNSSNDVQDNLAFIERELEQAKSLNIDLLQLPENFAQMPQTSAQQVIETMGQGQIQDFLCAQAKKNSINLIAGAMPILDNSKRDGASADKPFARSLLISNKGEVQAVYDKIHLFNVTLPNGEGYREADRFAASMLQQNQLTTHSIAGLRLGLSICYDLRFPEQYRALAAQGLDLVSVPAAFTYETGKKHWQTLLQARAIENLCYVFAAAQTGEHANGRCTWGHSMIIDPWGEVLAQADDVPGLIYADIDLTKLQDLRQRFPALDHRRLNS